MIVLFASASVWLNTKIDADSARQIFEKKKQCEPYLEKLKMLADQSDERYSFPSSNINQITDVFVCYSNKYNSCLSYTVVDRWRDADLNKHYIGYILTDLLTGTNVARLDKYMTEESSDRFYAERAAAFNKIRTGLDCAGGGNIGEN